MLSRPLVFAVLLAAVFWPLRALACINSMDSSAIFLDAESLFPTHTIWTDQFVWVVGAVFLNRVVLVNASAPAAEGQPPPSLFRRAFFLLVGACLVLVFAAVSAGGPLINLSAQHDVSRCTFDRLLLVLLMASPVVAFLLHSMLFQKVSRSLFGGDKKVAFVVLVVSAAVLALGVDLARAYLFVPSLCGDTLNLVPSVY